MRVTVALLSCLAMRKLSWCSEKTLDTQVSGRVGRRKKVWGEGGKAQRGVSRRVSKGGKARRGV